MTKYLATGANPQQANPQQYANTRVLEQVDRSVDLATAMAISGAAVSSNMGRYSSPLLAPSLALLNLRLGYWLANPRFLAGEGRRAIRFRRVSDFLARIKPIEFLMRKLRGRLFLVREIAGAIDENRSLIYLSDGGHIENLGAYELLKRGCQLIVVVDAEADEAYTFSSLTRLERFARIDLGVRLELPWRELADAARAAHVGDTRRRGPHAAIGRILYPDGNEGVLLYLKASVSGDERSYITDYKRRNTRFPHETTGDQFFSEEQFEAYRALGFHMMDGALTGNDTVTYLQTTPLGWSLPREAIEAVRDLLPTLRRVP